MDISGGEVTVNLNEELLSKSKSSSQSSSYSDNVMGSAVGSLDSKKTHKKQQEAVALSKYMSIFPEKVCGLHGFLLNPLFSIFFFVFGSSFDFEHFRNPF